MKTESVKVRKLTKLSLLAAVVVVLQLLGGKINFGGFSPSLVLVPVVIGSAVLGPGSGAFLGGVFGVVVLTACANGSDVSGNVLWTANTLYTILICMGKGVASGFASGIVFRALRGKNPLIASMLAAIVCPTVNTAIFCAGMVTVFHPILRQWAGGQDIVTYMLIGLVGINFLLELLLNVILSPAIYRIITHAGKRH